MKYTSDYLKFLYDDDDEDYNAFIVLISILNEVCQQSYETNTKMQHYTNYLCNNVKYVNEHINWVFDYLCKKKEINSLDSMKLFKKNWHSTRGEEKK